MVRHSTPVDAAPLLVFGFPYGSPSGLWEVSKSLWFPLASLLFLDFSPLSIARFVRRRRLRRRGR
jgi:hypothetical protein